MSETPDLESLRALAEKAIAEAATKAEWPRAARDERDVADYERMACAEDARRAEVKPWAKNVLALLSRLQECEKALRPFAEAQRKGEHTGMHPQDFAAPVDYSAAASYFQHSEKKADV